MRVAREVSSFSSFESSGAPSRALNMLLIFSFCCLKVQPYGLVLIRGYEDDERGVFAFVAFYASLTLDIAVQDSV